MASRSKKKTAKKAEEREIDIEAICQIMNCRVSNISVGVKELTIYVHDKWLAFEDLQLLSELLGTDQIAIFAGFSGGWDTPGQDSRIVVQLNDA